jgi:hypothetical protein
VFELISDCPVEKTAGIDMRGGFFFYYFRDGAATALATGVAGDGVVVLLVIGFAEMEAVFWDCGVAAVAIGADVGFPDPVAPVETVRTDSFFSGQNKIARIAMISNTITMVGQ